MGQLFPVDNTCPTSSYPSSALNSCETSFKNLLNLLAFVLMFSFLSTLSTLDVDEHDVVSSSLMSVLCDAISVYSFVIQQTLG